MQLLLYVVENCTIICAYKLHLHIHHFLHISPSYHIGLVATNTTQQGRWPLHYAAAMPLHPCNGSDMPP